MPGHLGQLRPLDPHSTPAVAQRLDQHRPVLRCRSASRSAGIPSTPQIPVRRVLAFSTISSAICGLGRRADIDVADPPPDGRRPAPAPRAAPDRPAPCRRAARSRRYGPPPSASPARRRGRASARAGWRSSGRFAVAAPSTMAGVDRAGGMVALGPAAQDHRVARLQAERARVGRDVGAAFVDDADHAQGRAHAADGAARWGASTRPASAPTGSGCSAMARRRVDDAPHPVLGQRSAGPSSHPTGPWSRARTSILDAHWRPGWHRGRVSQRLGGADQGRVLAFGGGRGQHSGGGAGTRAPMSAISRGDVLGLCPSSLSPFVRCHVVPVDQRRAARIPQHRLDVTAAQRPLIPRHLGGRCSAPAPAP